MSHEALPNPFTRSSESARIRPLIKQRSFLGTEGGRLRTRLLHEQGLVRSKDAEDVDEKKIDLSSEARALREYRTLEPGEFFIESLAGDRSPSIDQLTDQGERGFKFKECEHRPIADRDLSEFGFTETMIDDLFIDDSDVRDSLLAIDQVAERRVVAKVIDISEMIEVHKKLNAYKMTMTTGEIIEEMDARGYRPATLKELLSYGRSQWAPKELSSEDRERLADSKYVVALGTIIGNGSGDRSVATLYGGDYKRNIDAFPADYNWLRGFRFLFIRK